MPLPLIPAVILGASAATAVKGAIDTVTGISQITQEQRRYEEHRAGYDQAERLYQCKRAAVQQQLEDLGKARLRAMETLGLVVAFLRRARLTTVPVFDDLELTDEELEHWEGLSVAATGVIKGLASSAGAGVATALGTYGLVGTYGAASTGTAIASLSGAAATNATLAWLGGGALAAGGGGMALGTVVLGGLVAGPAVLVSGFFVAAHAEKVKTEVCRHIAAMEVAKAAMSREIAELAVVRSRADELQLGILRLALETEERIKTADDGCEEDVFAVARLAKTLAEIVKQPALDKSL